jgi:hypothetical protein
MGKRKLGRAEEMEMKGSRIRVGVSSYFPRFSLFPPVSLKKIVIPINSKDTINPTNPIDPTNIKSRLRQN